jgi:hypothetical protein
VGWNSFPSVRSMEIHCPGESPPEEQDSSSEKEDRGGREGGRERRPVQL